MFKQRICVCFTYFFLIFLPFAAWADSGKDLFIRRCGQCHSKTSQNVSKAPPISEKKYAGLQWKRFFERNKHQRKKDISALISDDEFKEIEKYLIDHAADTDQPEAIGFRKQTLK